MLPAVQGGGFFSSPASGYSHGLALLLLGRKEEEKPVLPWNQYRLVDGEGGISSEIEFSQHIGLFGRVIWFNEEEGVTATGSINRNGRKGYLKSNSKRDSVEHCIVVSEGEEPRESVEEVQALKAGIERRKVQCDGGLSDDELENEGFRKCECVIQ
ncbi:hypothetical protein BRADI_2g42285v3 [Brachypodium distachyon]|uniref:Uncharacterized protein n=1 Tax=Brachypodium distachyon TaxID=15368 RepID=A0A0Q3J7I2_BRADI|nr:hypothetical protein BRADI_2g42285v3 [Brachypodium distachyon]